MSLFPLIYPWRFRQRLDKSESTLPSPLPAGEGFSSLQILICRGDEGTGNRNGGCRVDYEIVHAVQAAPFSNKYHCGASIAPKDM